MIKKTELKEIIDYTKKLGYKVDIINNKINFYIPKLTNKILFIIVNTDIIFSGYHSIFYDDTTKKYYTTNWFEDIANKIDFKNICTKLINQFNENEFKLKEKEINIKLKKLYKDFE